MHGKQALNDRWSFTGRLTIDKLLVWEGLGGGSGSFRLARPSLLIQSAARGAQHQSTVPFLIVLKKKVSFKKKNLACSLRLKDTCHFINPLEFFRALGKADVRRYRIHGGSGWKWVAWGPGTYLSSLEGDPGEIAEGGVRILQFRGLPRPSRRKTVKGPGKQVLSYPLSRLWRNKAKFSFL